MHTLAEFDSLPINQVKSMLEKEIGHKLQKGIAERNIRDFARNKLHGKEFLNVHEVKKNSKIISETITIKTIFENCPQCKSKTLSTQPFHTSSEMYNSKYCKSCGYWNIPSKDKPSKKEVI